MTQKTAHEVFRDVAVWVITGVCGFLAYNSWQTSLSLREVVVEIKHVVEKDDEYEKRLAAIHDEISTIRKEQVSRSKSVYSMASLDSRLTKLESDVSSRHNKRWNLPDMQALLLEWARLNPELKMPLARNGNE